ncbi:hypothetical protein ACP70R_005364 [Stipagrostis hirtigluma subsp. patula]
MAGQFRKISGTTSRRGANFLTALAQLALPNLSLLEIEVFFSKEFSAARVASLLRAAARLDPLELSLIARVGVDDRDTAIDVPCFARATSIYLVGLSFYLTLPEADGVGFPALESLCISACQFDTGALISRCPRLRTLQMRDCFIPDTIMVHSASIEELVVRRRHNRVCGIDVDAPLLKKFTLDAQMHPDFRLALLAPLVENHSWDCFFGTGSQFYVQFARNLQEMFPISSFSVLELRLETRGHVFGAMVLNLLRNCNAIQKLKLVIERREETDEQCPPNCDCDQPQNWRSQNISLRILEEVEIENFKGSDHEVDFLKLLFRCAPLTKVIVKLTYKAARSSKGCKEIYHIFKANASVECYVYNKRGKEIMYT